MAQRGRPIVLNHSFLKGVGRSVGYFILVYFQASFSPCGWPHEEREEPSQTTYILPVLHFINNKEVTVLRLEVNGEFPAEKIPAADSPRRIPCRRIPRPTLHSSQNWTPPPRSDAYPPTNPRNFRNLRYEGRKCRGELAGWESAGGESPAGNLPAGNSPVPTPRGSSIPAVWSEREDHPNPPPTHCASQLQIGMGDGVPLHLC